MKKVTLSIAALAAMGTFAMAGGSIAPVEPVVETPVVAAPQDAGFYVGMAYGLGNMGLAYNNYPDPSYDHDENFDALMLQAGYKINPYVAVEGRYWFTDGEWSDIYGSADFSADAWGIYVKPMYPVTNEIDIYALLGYGDTDPEIGGGKPPYDTDGFQWGLGASYEFTSDIAVFMDYVSLYDDTNSGEDLTIDTWNFGVTYKF
ncbi:porin family protein [Sulfurovum sp. ST-21]|uniref:Porin family protein n=1 Tax=Sulfurovum indicum TaxID=2779528 RepID=A0A7M1S5K4_9BACT|nr:porin family protein [Sulfurovum indicum]QOR62019.1 porin family protein [Sulfurovum indicum]